MGTQVIVVPSCFISTRRFFDKVTKTSERIDIEKLKAREQIMFFDDVLLFEDELHDHGVSMISVKIVSSVLFFFLIIHPFSTLADTFCCNSVWNIWLYLLLAMQRVMPTSFFLLLRFFLRVDGVLIRINDTRLYHEASCFSFFATGPFEHCCVWVHKSFFITFMLLFFLFPGRK